MDYVDILKRAWRVTWGHKTLWVLGLFAGGYSTGSGGGGLRGYSFDTGSTPEGPEGYIEAAAEWMQANIELVVVAAIALVILGVIMWVLSIAATGGLVRLVDDLERGHWSGAARGWGAGFAVWGRVFLVGLILVVPVVIVLGGIALLGVVFAVGAARGGEETVAGAIIGMCGLIALLVPLVLVAGFIVGVLHLLAIRFAVLFDMPATGAIGAAWRSFRGRFKDVLLMWLVMFGVGIAYGFAMAFVAVVLFVPAVLVGLAGGIGPAVGLGAIGGLVMLVPSAAYGTFASSAWTVFFRRLAGLEQRAESAVQPGSWAPGSGTEAPGTVLQPRAPRPDVAPPLAPQPQAPQPQAPQPQAPQPQAPQLGPPPQTPTLPPPPVPPVSGEPGDPQG